MSIIIYRQYEYAADVTNTTTVHNLMLLTVISIWNRRVAGKARMLNIKRKRDNVLLLNVSSSIYYSNSPRVDYTQSRSGAVCGTIWSCDDV